MEPKKQNRPTFAFYIAIQHSALLTGESGGDFMERSGNKLFPQVGFAEQNFFMPDSYKFYPTFVTKWTHKKEKDIVEMWNNHFFQCTVWFYTDPKNFKSYIKFFHKIIPIFPCEQSECHKTRSKTEIVSQKVRRLFFVGLSLIIRLKR